MADFLSWKSTECHPRFLLDRYRSTLGSAVEPRGEIVTSPHDVHVVEEARDRFFLRTGRKVPVDVCVWGIGDPPRPEMTRVGGSPYMSNDTAWPEMNGYPMAFLCQINFSDSLDVLPVRPPHPLLLVFVENEERALLGLGEEQLRFVWQPVGSSVTPLPPDASPPSCLSFFRGFAALHRTHDYPDAEDEPWDKVEQGYLLPSFQATKMGGSPSFVQEAPNAFPPDAVYLCQIASVQAASNVLWPFVNHEKSLNLGSGPEGIYDHAHELCMMDMASVYVCLLPDGTVESHVSSY